MNHIAKFRVRENFFKPYNVQCSCGVGGEFLTQDEARLWMQSSHFDKLRGVFTAKFEEKKLPIVAPAQRTAEHPQVYNQRKQFPGPPAGTTLDTAPRKGWSPSAGPTEMRTAAGEVKPALAAKKTNSWSPEAPKPKNETVANA